MQLHEKFLELCPNVYFQPPDGLTMKYPAILYNLNGMDTKFANNLPYGSVDGYSVTVIDKDPDGSVRKMVASFPLCAFNRFFPTEGLNHYVFTLFF